MTKVVHIQYSTKSAGTAAFRLHKAFLENNIQSSIVSLELDAHKNNGIKYLGKLARITSRADQRLQRYFTKKTIPQFGLYSNPVLGTSIDKIDEVKEADIIYIHWALNGFLNFKSFETLAQLNKPVIFFMHDMWNITGGCHYSFDCNKYLTGCNNCQVFEENKNNDLAARQFKKKLQLYTKFKNLYFISPSKWLYNCAKEALLTKSKSVYYIPNVLDNTLFKPFDKTIAKKILNIDPDEIVIAFGAVSVDSPYKGWPYLQKALQILADKETGKKISVLIFGSGYSKIIEQSIPFKTKFMGYLGDEYSTMLVYNAADVFIVPSLADNQPTTIQESLCCGTPVVGFNVGGIPDMISHKQNGYLAKYKDPEDIYNGIKYCLDNKTPGFLLPSFEPALIIKKHEGMFKEIKNI